MLVMIIIRHLKIYSLKKGTTIINVDWDEITEKKLYLERCVSILLKTGWIFHNKVFVPPADKLDDLERFWKEYLNLKAQL